MKKFIAFILALTVALCLLSACKKIDEDATSTPVPSAPVGSIADSSNTNYNENSSNVVITHPTDNELNAVLTLGNVNITLYESTLHREGWYGDGTHAGTAYTDDEIIADAANYDAWLADQELMPGVAINKMPYVKNTGKSDAYIRIRVMIPSALELDCFKSSIYNTAALEEEFTFVGDWETPYTFTVDGLGYDVYTFVRNNTLSPGEMTYWNVWNTICMESDTTFSDLQAWIDSGAVNAKGQFNVRIQADAIVADGFEDAFAAFKAFDSVVTNIPTINTPGNNNTDSSVDLSQPTDNTEDSSKEETEMYTVKMEVKDYGTITLELDPTYAPITVANFVRLADMGFYDGLTFHRIIEGFMIQGGDPNHNGTGGSDVKIKGEFAANGVNNPLSHKRGVISMARAMDPNSASSQFFIMHQDNPNLDGLYAAFGVVTEGMDVVDAIASNARPIDNNGTMLYDEQPVITKVTVVK